MKIVKSRLVTIGLVLFLGGLDKILGETNPTADVTARLDNNPYIEIYKLRIAQAETNLKRQEALITLANQRLDRGRRLIAKSAIAQEDLDLLISEAGVASADLELARKKVEESKSYFRIVEALVKRGVSIPLCTYEME